MANFNMNIDFWKIALLSWKCIIQPAFGVCSTQTLVKIYNKPDLFLDSLLNKELKYKEIFTFKITIIV